MAVASIEIIIDEDGTLNSKAEGFYGGKCRDVKTLIEQLGRVVESEHNGDQNRACDNAVEVVPSFARR